MGESREKPDAKVSEVKDKELWVILEKRQKNIKWKEQIIDQGKNSNKNQYSYIDLTAHKEG